jgi:hypothetical protein
MIGTQMENVWNWSIDYVKNKLYPFTLQHLIYAIVTTVAVYYVTEYFLKFRLIRWIYFGTLTVIAAALFNNGEPAKGGAEIFKIATI